MQIQTNSVASTQAVSLLGDNKTHFAGASSMEHPVKIAEDQSQAVQAVTSSSGSEEDVQDAVDKLNEAIKTMASNGLEFSVDKDAKVVVVKVVDRQTEEVIRQIPSEEVLQIAKAMEKLKGLLVQDKA